MEIDITPYFQTAAPRDYSASVAEIGANAGPNTWRAACEDAPDYPFLDTDEKREAFREFVNSSGGWTRDEIAAWTDVELSALFLQWISGDVRELFPDSREVSALTAEDWSRAEESQQTGSAPANIYRGDSGRVYFYAGGLK